MVLRTLGALVSAATLLSSAAMAAEPSVDWGTTAAPDVVGTSANRQRAPLGTVSPANVFTGATYSTGGVGMRNRLVGGIEVSAVVKPSKAAFLYWAVITT